jgi:23S rRNA pseudouridine1911/1915/1917 synthase
VSRKVAAELIASGAVRLDGLAATVASTRTREGQQLDIELPSSPTDDSIRPDPSVELNVVYSDDDVVVINKPAGLVVHPGSGHFTGTLVHGLLARFPETASVGEPHRPGIVHRLDRGTSGLLVVARSARAYRSLVAQLAAHTAGRTYLAIVFGVPESRVGVVDAPVGRSTRDRTRMAVRPEGKAARTRYEVLREFRHPAASALVECQLETGRTHQIRVHLSAIGNPVVGDPQYKGGRASIHAPRPMLHAARLAFEHPGTGERVEFEAPLPSDMAAVLATLEE